MDRYQNSNPRLDRLPREPIDHVTRPLARFLRIETASGAILLLAVAVALVLANSAWAHGVATLWETPVGVHAGPFAFQRPLRDWITLTDEIQEGIKLSPLGDRRDLLDEQLLASGGPQVSFLGFEPGVLIHRRSPSIPDQHARLRLIRN